MATYKVIQDIEAEDKFVGPLTLKQFIFAMAGILFGYLNFFAISRGATLAMVIFAPPMLLAFFLAVPWSKEQPTEVWVLAKLRFRIKPKKRIWDQDGLQELVKITAPKKIERNLTNNLSEKEVTGRLKILAETIDSRGWAIKNSTLTAAHQDIASDRLVDPAILPQQVPEIDDGVEDMLDTDNSVSIGFDQMMQSSSDTLKGQSLDKMERVRRGEPIEAINQPDIRFVPPQPQPPFQPINPPEQSLSQPEKTRMSPAQQQPLASTVPPISASADDQVLSQQLKQQRQNRNIPNSHMRSISSKPTDNHKAQVPLETKSLTGQAGMTSPSTPAIMNLAQNDDLNVETIARQAKKANQQDNSDEVVISLR